MVTPKRTIPWKGPFEHGMTCSMISHWLQCRHTFWLAYCKGLEEQKPFDLKLEYGNLFHAYLEGGIPLLKKETQKLHKKYVEHEEIDYWARIAELQAKDYSEHCKSWDRKNKVEILSLEDTFFYQIKISEVYPKVTIRGKMDGLLRLGKTEYLFESKTKGYLDEEFILDTLPHNFQVMTYLLGTYCGAVFEKYQGEFQNVKDILYNVVRRPFSDKHSPRAKKGETKEQLVERAFKTYEARSDATIYPIEKNRESWYFRYKARIKNSDLQRFLNHCFIPIMNQIILWWNSVEGLEDPFESPLHYKTPYGLFRPQEFGMKGQFYDLLIHNKKSNIFPRKTCFPEL